MHRTCELVAKDIEIKETTDKFGIKRMKAPRYIATSTVREIKRKLNDKFSRGTICNYRPFFVGVATEREKLECLCKTCLNPRLLHNALMKEVKAKMECVHSSISQYFISGKSCQYARSGYTHFDCITGDCKKCEGLIQPPTYQETCSSGKTITFYQYESVPYKNKKGEDKKRTERVQYETEVAICKQKLDDMAKKYLIHRYDVEHDKLIWPQILEKASENQEMVLHQDYSEKIQEQPKFEPQDMYWSKKSHNLHCTVLHKSTNSEDNEYFYHFSDVLKQDWKFLAVVDAAILQAIECNQQIVRKKSDNCAVQYKSLKVFGYYVTIAIKSGKVWIIYFGSEGHGRSLVDAMSSFGVKAPLRKEIVNKDFYWTKAKQLVDLFQKKNMPVRYHYEEVTKEEIDLQDCNQKEYPIKGCRKLRMIAFHPDGLVEKAAIFVNVMPASEETFSNACTKKRRKYWKKMTKKKNLMMKMMMTITK